MGPVGNAPILRPPRHIFGPAEPIRHYSKQSALGTEPPRSAVTPAIVRDEFAGLPETKSAEKENSVGQVREEQGRSEGKLEKIARPAITATKFEEKRAPKGDLETTVESAKKEAPMIEPLPVVPSTSKSEPAASTSEDLRTEDVRRPAPRGGRFELHEATQSSLRGNSRGTDLEDRKPVKKGEAAAHLEVKTAEPVLVPVNPPAGRAVERPREREEQVHIGTLEVRIVRAQAKAPQPQQPQPQPAHVTVVQPAASSLSAGFPTFGLVQG
jgi:hypothetical protein